MKKIVVKEIDKLISKIHKGKIVTEYLVTLVIDDLVNIPIESHIELGETAKKLRVNELIMNNFLTDDNVLNMNKDEMIIEVSFEEFLKQSY
jgi:hypothetical protein